LAGITYIIHALATAIAPGEPGETAAATSVLTL
jgi:hypothetical protein